jgi:NAD/NADP transhydrogenase alpha subunit
VFTAYVVVTLMAIAASTFVAIANFIRLEFVLSTAAKVGVSESWMTTLGTLNAAAALGLLLGLIGVPLIGTAAAVGLVLYFVGAIITHLRARDHSIGPAAAFLVLAVAALVLGLVS